MKKLLFGFLISLFLIQSAYSAVPNSFTNNTVADADEVNENFTYFENKFSTTSGHDHDNSDSKLLTTLSTITSGEWRGTILDEPYGGTGKGSYASGDLLYATADVHLAKLSKPALLGTILLFSSINSTPEWLAAGSTGDVLRSNGIQTNPYWTNELPASLITSGTLGTARLGSGTASSSNFLRGDSSWQQVSSLSNVIFSWSGVDNYAAGNTGFAYTTDITSASPAALSFAYIYNDTTAYVTMLNFKFVKIAGISTITIYARMWSTIADGDKEALMNVDIGGQSNTVKTVTSATPTWVTTSTIDVSGLTNGTAYDGVVQLKNETSGYGACASAVTLTGS